MSALAMRTKEGFTATGRGLCLSLVVIPQLLLGTLVWTAASLVGIGVGILLLPPLLVLVRRMADHNRRRAGQWGGVRIARPYQDEPPADAKVWQRFTAHLGDVATWRDLGWLAADPFVGLTLAIFPAGLIANGLFGMLMPLYWEPIFDAGGTQWYTFVPVQDTQTALFAVPVGLLQIALGVLFAQRIMELHGKWTSVLLAPTKEAELAQRVQKLTETRADAVDANAAELRRIERDLHDGAQARLVAMGMNLGAAEALLERDPAQARLLLVEARTSSAKALNELRDLVRGIHPPVLADRGLGDAVKALALDLPFRVHVTADLPGRLEAPVESAAYFAVSECLANVGKHAGAAQVSVDIAYGAGKLQLIVTDDGVGGADLMRGTGLRGIERRLGTFDGVLALHSPVGGPTVVTMELPCALSSPKTFSS